MLTHAFTSAIGAWQILAGVCGLADGDGDAGADLAILNATCVGFTLGALTIEATKHLSSTEAGPLIGLTRLPSLRAWRARLGAIGDAADPLALQSRLVKAILAVAPAPREVFLADDHHVEYTDGKPVGQGRNPRRGKPTKGHGDTYTTDLGGRALPRPSSAASAAKSPTHPPPSPSPSTSPANPACAEPSPNSSTRSTTPRRPSPATPDPSPTKSPTHDTANYAF
jgi:hypothetical protein